MSFQFRITNIQLRNAEGSLLGLAEDTTVTCQTEDLDAIFEAVKTDLGVSFDPSFSLKKIDQ